MSSGPCSTASARTARSAPTTTPSRSSATTPITTPRATSSTTRRRPVSMTTSHLRFGPRPIQSTYLVNSRQFRRLPPVLLPGEVRRAGQGGDAGATFLLNSPFGPDEVWDQLPRAIQQQHHRQEDEVLRHRALQGGREYRHGWRASTPSCRPVSSPSPACCPETRPSRPSREAIKKTYGRKGEDVVQQNYEAVDQTLANLHEVKVPAKATSAIAAAAGRPCRSAGVRSGCDGCHHCRATATACPVERMPVDGTFPTATTQWEKRNIALEIPVWDPDVCIQCGKCSLVCPHAAIRMKVYDRAAPGECPGDLQVRPTAWQGIQGPQGHHSGRARGLHRLRRSACMSVRPRTRTKQAAKPSTWTRSCRSASRNARITSSS